MSAPVHVRYQQAFERVTFLPNRVPSLSGENGDAYFAKLADYRDGGIFIASYAGNSEWERHGQGDEIVFVLEGQTTLILFKSGAETRHVLNPGELLVVPQHRWHRFETPEGVKVMSITPQPTDHSLAPEEDAKAS